MEGYLDAISPSAAAGESDRVARMAEDDRLALAVRMSLRSLSSMPAIESPSSGICARGAATMTTPSI